MNENIAIVGIGETPAVRRSPKDVRTLVTEAILEALADAGIHPAEVDGIVTESSVMPTTVPHDYIAAQLGIRRYFDASMSYAGAGIVAAPSLAELAIKSGRASVVISYFGVNWGSNPSRPYNFHERYPAKSAFEKPIGFSGQPIYFGIWAQRYMRKFGVDESRFGALAVQQRANARLTGRAQKMDAMSLDDYLSSPMISSPLRQADCCLVSDGACAFVMTSAERARDCRKTPIYVRGVGYASEHIAADDVFTQTPDLMTIPAVAMAREAAERAAGFRLTEADFAEIYDCFTISALMQIEDLGFCVKGEGADFVAEGNTRIDGRLPVNTHGGLLSYSYRMAAEHVIETVRQLRYEAGANQVKDAEVGFATGLSPPDYGILVLGR